MSNFSEREVKRIWKKGKKIDDKDPSEYRLDAAGALIRWSHRGTDSRYDWEIDHVCPKAKLEEAGVPEEEWDNEHNLRPFNAKNNNRKSDEYPCYTKVLEYDEERGININCEKRMEVNENVQRRIRQIFGI